MTLLSDLEHAVTAYDRKQANRRGYNPYALAQYLIRASDVAAQVQGKVMPWRAAVATGFSDRLRDHVIRHLEKAGYRD
jgi:hypothetical protein